MQDLQDVDVAAVKIKKQRNQQTSSSVLIQRRRQLERNGLYYQEVGGRSQGERQEVPRSLGVALAAEESKRGAGGG